MNQKIFYLEKRIIFYLYTLFKFTTLRIIIIFTFDDNLTSHFVSEGIHQTKRVSLYAVLILSRFKFIFLPCHFRKTTVYFCQEGERILSKRSYIGKETKKSFEEKVHQCLTTLLYLCLILLIHRLFF